MARDPNGRFDTALAFGNAIRNSVSTLGGPATPQDLARLLATDFAEEMAARDEILKAAEEPAPVAPPPIPRAARSTSPPPIPQARSGEVGQVIQREPSTKSQLEAVPSMIVQGGSSRAYVPLPPVDILDLSSNVLPDSWMVDPSTDLLHSHRMRSLRNAGIALGALILVGVAIFFAATHVGDSGARVTGGVALRSRDD